MSDDPDPNQTDLVATFRDAGDKLQPRIQELILQKSDSLAQTVINAQGMLWEAASRINAEDLATLLSSNSDARDRLQQITKQMGEKASQLARDEANMARLVKIATAALQVAGAVVARDVPSLLKALGDILGQLSGV